jgi:hypothetical protein
MTKTVFGLTLLLLTALPRGVFADPIPSGGVGQNVSVVGYSNLDDRPGFKMSIVESNGRWYLYMGHLWHFGWSIVDVTDPSSPKVVKFIPGPSNTWTIQMEISGNSMITALEQIADGWGGDPAKPYDEGVLIWDISDRLNPSRSGNSRLAQLVHIGIGIRAASTCISPPKCRASKITSTSSSTSATLLIPWKSGAGG